MSPQDQVKAKVEEYLHQAWKESDDGMFNREALKDAIIFGLKLARGAGPDGMLFGGGSKTCELHKQFRCEGCEWWNDALTAKNTAIDEIIKSIK